MIMDRLYGGVCYAGIDTDPELKYPKGAGRVAFSNQQSYIAAISARFVQLQHGEIDKRVRSLHTFYFCSVLSLEMLFHVNVCHCEDRKYQINCIFRAGLCHSDTTQNKNAGVVRSCCFWNVGGNCEADFLKLLCIMGSVSAALPFCKNIALVISSHCKYLRLQCVITSGRQVSAEDGAVPAPVLPLWTQGAECGPPVTHGVLGVPKEHRSRAL